MNLEQTVDFIVNKIPEPPHTAVILGSGCGEFTSKLKDPIYILYANIPHYPHSSIVGHAGEWVYGYINDKPIISASGRFHYYEGFTMEELAFPVSIANLLGCKKLIITNASGCLRKEWQLGDLMLITGYLDYSFRKKSDTSKIVQFNSNTKYYNKVRCIASDLDISLREGIYTWVLGPSYETPAEIMEMISLGCHSVGMSTVPEILKADALGLEFIGISCLSNYGAGLTKNILSHVDVLKITKIENRKFSNLLLNIV